MKPADRYRKAGVDLRAAELAKAKISEVVAAARSDLALGVVGAFGGMVRLPPDIPDPVLVMSTDGVGTKVLVAARAGRHDTVGEDLVNHCVNDILVHGARPLAFLDYIATDSLDPDAVARLVEGVARGCRAHDMTLAGGETAEMPGVYREGVFDLAGTILGVVSDCDVLHGDRIRVGDLLLGYESTGLHTNGYTLARHIVFERLGLELDSVVPDLDVPIADALLAPHRSYHAAVAPVLSRMHGLAHITGGGIPGNLSRSLPAGCAAAVDSSQWVVPPLFSFLQEAGGVERDEMLRVFNMGIGMIGVVPSDQLAPVQDAARAAAVPTWVIGEVVRGAGAGAGAAPGVRID